MRTFQTKKDILVNLKTIDVELKLDLKIFLVILIQYICTYHTEKLCKNLKNLIVEFGFSKVNTTFFLCRFCCYGDRNKCAA